MKILFAVDGSDYTKRMLAYVAAHDELLGANHEHVFLTVVPGLPALAASQLPAGILEDYFSVEAEEVFRSVRAFAEMQGWAMRLEAARGHLATAIVDFAEREKPALIVMGSHGRGVLGNLALGSVSNAVIANTRIPVLLIR
jgi:nucleotide-binding universal stress UspA family protein